ncbi:MAG: hypothetical protein QG608_2771, partial [Actinomycetota bacterium]|nr:hypothetical protein [Actinomycetota bacterium]
MDRVDPLPGSTEGPTGPPDRGRPALPVVPHHPSHRMLLQGRTRGAPITRTLGTARGLLSARGLSGRSPGRAVRPDALIVPTR